MGSSSQTKSESAPPEWATPLYEQSASEASRLYNSGVGGNTYLGPTVAEMSDTTLGGVNQLAQAGQAWDTSASRPLFQGIGAASVMPSYAEQNLGTIASGGDNPYFQEALQNQLGDTADMIQSRMSGAGRYGSGAHTGVLANDLGKISTQALSNQWNQNIQNQLAATGQMDASRLSGLGLGLQSAGQIANMDQQQFQNSLTGADATLKAGGIMDNYGQKLLDDEINRFYSLDNQDWQRLGLLQSSAAGAAGPYGQQLSETHSSNPAQMIGGIGSAIGGAKGG